MYLGGKKSEHIYSMLFLKTEFSYEEYTTLSMFSCQKNKITNIFLKIHSFKNKPYGNTFCKVISNYWVYTFNNKEVHFITLKLFQTLEDFLMMTFLSSISVIFVRIMDFKNY